MAILSPHGRTFAPAMSDAERDDIVRRWQHAVRTVSDGARH